MRSLRLRCSRRAGDRRFDSSMVIYACWRSQTSERSIESAAAVEQGCFRPRRKRSRKGIQPLCTVAGESSSPTGSLCAGLSVLAGCATMRRNAPSPDLRPCTDGYAYTEDGWRLGVRHYRPRASRPGQAAGDSLPWPGTQRHLLDDHRQPSSRPSWPPGATRSTSSTSAARAKTPRSGRRDRVNKVLAPDLLEGARRAGWTVDDLVKYDVPAILDYVKRETGHDRVNWIGHSLGGMLVFPYLELAPHPERIANFVGMGSTIIQAEDPPDRHARGPTKGSGSCRSSPAPAGWAGRWRSVRVPGMELIDRFYYSNENVDRLTDLAVLRLHARGHRAGRLAPARPLSRVRPHALGGPHDRLLGDAGRDHDPHPPGRRRRRHHVGRPVDRADLRRPGQPRQGDDEVRQVERPRGRLRPLRPGLEPSCTARRSSRRSSTGSTSVSRAAAQSPQAVSPLCATA